MRTRQTWELYALCQKTPAPEHPPDWAFLFHLLGIEGRAAQREIYERLGTMLQLIRAHEEASKPENQQVFKNPHA